MAANSRLTVAVHALAWMALAKRRGLDVLTSVDSMDPVSATATRAWPTLFLANNWIPPRIPFASPVFTPRCATSLSHKDSGDQDARRSY